MNKKSRKIPSPVISFLSENMSEFETHDSINNLFLYAEAPEDIPEGSKKAKVTSWLRNVNKESRSPLTVLGLLVESYMEYIEDLPQSYNPIYAQNKAQDNQKELKEKLNHIFKRCDLKYISEGVISDLTSEPAPLHQNSSFESIKKQTQTVAELNTENWIPPTKWTPPTKELKKNKIFIAHGQDNEAKQEVARFIDGIGLEAIILHERANGGMSIIKKIEHYSKEAGYAVILYTPCDLGKGANDTSRAKSRARQNVVFEHGYLMAKLNPENIFTLVKGEHIEKPNDISGIVYENMDLAGAWKMKLKQELEEAGYKLTK